MTKHNPMHSEAVSARYQRDAQQRARNETDRLAVILVNWNRHQDTIECLESLLRSDTLARIIIVDNGSHDGSLDRLKAWASGDEAYEPPAGPLGRLTRPPAAKPIDLKILSPEEAYQNPLGAEQITVIASPQNLGFAAANNLAVRHALKDSSIGYLWCLNNDTVVEADAIAALVATLDATHKVGMCGTQVRFYHRPGHWQALNGQRFNLLTGQSRAIGKDRPISRLFDPRSVARQTDFVAGTSLAISRSFIETIGYMNESYFLYFEEMDWSVRNRGRFAIAFAHGSIVYHKEGGSIGSSSKKGERSPMSEYYLMRSRLKFYRNNFPLLLPLQYPLGGALILRRLWRRHFKKASAILRALLGMPYKMDEPSN